MTWVLATSFIVAAFPLIISMEREQTMLEMEKQMQTVPAPQSPDLAAPTSGIPDL